MRAQGSNDQEMPKATLVVVTMVVANLLIPSKTGRSIDKSNLRGEYAM